MILSEPTLSNDLMVYCEPTYGIDDESVFGIVTCIMGRPLTHKPSTCPHANEMGALREGGTRQYIKVPPESELGKLAYFCKMGTVPRYFRYGIEV